jgi:peptidyl-tRNA hydrolase
MPAEKSRMKEFVLEIFPESELNIVTKMVEQARDACLSFITDGIDQAMNKFNGIQIKDLIN